MMATWVVVHHIHVTVPHRHIPQLVVTHVPENGEVTFDLVERAGFWFGEFGIPRANHYIIRLDEAPSELVARVKSGQGQRITYEKLVALAEADIE